MLKYYIIGGMTLGMVFMISAMLLISNMTPLVEDKPVEEKQWYKIYVWTPLGEEAAATGASQFLGIYFVNHTATPNTAYDTNASDDLSDWANATFVGKTAYATADAFHLELTHSVSFDIVVRVMYNKTHGPWDGSAWDNASWRVNITISGAITEADTTGVNVETENDSAKDFYWGNCYWTNAGSGYTLTADGTATISEISIEARY